MRIERTKNATRNIIYGSALKVFQIIMPFIMRTAMIYYLGVEYLGLNSLFTSVLNVLNLAELGVGNAMVYSMYKPIAEDDEVLICALLKRYRLYYRLIGSFIAIIGIILLPFIPKLINGTVPSGMDIYVLYLLNLGATVLTYWLFAYKNSLLNAHQRNDVISKVSIMMESFRYLIQLFILIVLHNYYLFLVVNLGIQILLNIITAVIVSNMYPNYRPIGNLPNQVIVDINSKIRDLFTSRLGGVIVNSADSIVISAFLGLSVLAVYENYYYILTAIIGFINIILESCSAGIGNSIILESNEKNYKDLKKLTLLVTWIAGFCTCCLLCLYQPFMEIWVGKDMQLRFSAVILFCIYYFVYEINRVLNIYKDAAGIWHEDRFRPLITAFVNLLMNLIMVQFWGIYGVLLSTVISTILVGMPWLLYNLFSTLFTKENLNSYIRKLLLYTCIVTVICGITWILCIIVPLKGVACLIIRAIICLIIPNILFFVVFSKQSEFFECVLLIDNMTRNKFKLQNRIKQNNDRNV